MTYARVVIVLRLYLLEQCLNPVLRTLIKTRNFVTFHEFLIHRGVHHTYSKVFEVYTDVSSKQLGAVITQDNRPIAFFSRKLSETQCKYSITKIELLAIVKTLKEFNRML
jgi:hypothetical protein